MPRRIVNRLQRNIGLLHQQNDATMKRINDMLSMMENFSSEQQCLQYLTDLKWKDGYCCRRCAHERSIKGRTWHHRRCQKCGYDESCTAHTLFHKLKFPIVKAFWIVHQLSTMKKGLSTLEISRQYGIHQESAWYFKRKVQAAMENSGQPLLSGIVQVDETVIGGFEPGAVGRSQGKRQGVQIAVEVNPTEDGFGKVQIKNARAVIIDNYSSAALSTGIEAMIDSHAAMMTDQWTAYPKAAGGRFHIALPSEKGSGMPEIHHIIFNVKNWLRGIHHKVSPEHLQSYLGEYFYRFNHRNTLNTITDRVLRAMTKHEWLPYKSAVAA